MTDDPHNAAQPDDSPGARFGAELRRLREHAGLTVRRLAQDLHRAHSGIVEYERGRRLPGVEVVEQYEDYFGLTRGALVAQRERARIELLERPRDGTLAEHLGEAVCPYKGLRAFQSEDASLFFGREQQVDEVLAELAASRFVAVVGASGSGKSSFVRAGLIAGIRSRAGGGEDARVALLTPGDRPVDELASAVASVTGDAAGGLAEEIRADPGALGGAISTGSPVVVVVDQFEELFTLCGDEEERRCFVDALIGAWSDPSSPVSVIVALRADFYGRVATYPQLAAAVVSHQALIGPMSSTDLRRAIELPASRSGLLLQSGLVDTMLEDLADEPGALPLLSHALLETWKRRQRLQLTVGGYRDAGGVRGAIARTAEHTLQQMSDADRTVARSIFLSLTDLDEGAEPTGRRIDRSELASHPEAAAGFDRVLGVLADARLLSIDEDTVVVAHEALIRHWPRLRAWIDADRAGLLTHRRLTQAAREWNALEREQAALYRGARLAAAREWVPDHAAGLSRLEREFLSASEAAHRRERTVRRRGVALVLAALTTGLVAAVVAAVFANEQRDIAESRDLAAKSSALVATDPWVALALAFEALRHSDTEQAREALRQATLAQRAKYVIPAHSGILFGVAPSPDGRLAATAGGDRIVRIWSVATGRRVGEIRGYGGEVRAVSFSPDSKHLVSAASDGEIAVALATGGTRHVVARLRGGEYASSIDFGADARTVVIGTSAGRVALVGLGDGALHDLGPRSTEYVEAVAFDKRARKVVSAGDDGMARIWNVAGGAPVVLGHGNDARGAGQIVAAAFRPDGRQVATVDELGSVLLWDARTGRRLNEIAIGDKQQASVRFSADGARIVTAGVDGVVHLWRPREHAALAEFRGHHGQVRAAFVPGHDEIVSAGEEDGTLRIWTVPSTKVPPQPGVAPRFSNDGRLVVSIAPDDATLHVWNPKTGEDRTYGGLQKINSARFSPDGTQLVGASSDGRVMLWDVASGQAHPVHTGEGEKLDVAMDPSGTRIAFGGNVPLVIQSTDGTHVVRLRGHRGRVNALVFSPDGRHLLTGSDDTTARIWNARTGALERTVSAHQGVVGSVSYSKDGARFATAGSDGTVALWRVAGGEPVILAGHTLAVNSAEFNPRGDRVVTAGEDGTVRVWNAAGGDPIVLLDRYEQSADGADFSRDGRYVVSAAGDGMRLSLCEVCGSAADVLRLARTRAQHTLTALERRRLLPGG